MSPRRVVALARHAVHANLAMPFTWCGGAVVAGAALLGPVLSLWRFDTWALDGDLLGTGFAFGALFVVRSGIAEQRTGGLQDFLRLNFVTPLEHVAAAALSIVASWLVLAAFTWAGGAALSPGDVRAVTWTVWILLLGLGMLLPFALMVECASDLRTPLVIPGFVYFATLLTLGATMGPHEATALFGLNTDPASFRSSLPLAARAGVLFAAGTALVLGGTALRGRRARRRRRSARAAG